MNNHKQWQEMYNSKKELLEDFKDKKFGMFIHFGLYSMLAGEYKGKRIEEGRRPFVAEWIMHAFNISREEYSALADDFNPENFTGDAFAELAVKAGMKYIVITSKHHDGFALYDSRVSDYTMMNTPCGKDLILDLHGACRKRGIAFGLYYSHSIDWKDGGDGGMRDYKNNENRHYGLHAYNEWDPNPQSFDEYIKNKALPQMKEILENYKDLYYIWYDVPYYIPDKYSYEFYKIINDVQPRALVSFRVGNGYGDIACPGDNVIPENGADYEGAWETVGTMNNSWGFKHYDHDWKYPKEVLFWLIEIVSKGGNYMLNIGPDGKGNIPTENVAILSEIGSWLKVNGDALYGTRSWDISHEGPAGVEMGGTTAREKEGFNLDFSLDDFWFTKKENHVYCISLYSGSADKVVLKSLSDCDIKSIVLLDGKIALSWHMVSGGVEVTLPESFSSDLGFVLRVELSSVPSS